MSLVQIRVSFEYLLEPISLSWVLIYKAYALSLNCVDFVLFTIYDWVLNRISHVSPGILYQRLSRVKGAFTHIFNIYIKKTVSCDSQIEWYKGFIEMVWVLKNNNPVIFSSKTKHVYHCSHVVV